MAQITILPEGGTVHTKPGESLLEVLRRAGFIPDAPCGGQGTCGKCRVLADGMPVLACRTPADRDMTVQLPETKNRKVLRAAAEMPKGSPAGEGYGLAFDIGTTTLVCYLTDCATGETLAQSGMPNPQRGFGADVVSRIRAALDGELEALTALIRRGMTELARELCRSRGIDPDGIRVVSVVGNPAMQQLFLGISPRNLAAVPFVPVLREAKRVPCGEYLPLCAGAEMLIVPDISGYVGADTMGCVLSTQLYLAEEMTLLVDIGTNGEIVLGNRHRMVACATAAGPALEGANIRFGMRAAEGAIDHVRLEDGRFVCSVIGGGEAVGVCGSGLIDAAAAALEAGLLNKRGKILGSEERERQRILPLTDNVYLTQEDIRQLQLAKGAVCAGIRLMAKQLSIDTEQIRRVLLAGAFGTYLDPRSACRIGLLPEELEGKIRPVGNAAGSGAKLLACNRELLSLTGSLADQIEFLELAGLPEFPRTFALAMNFREVTP